MINFLTIILMFFGGAFLGLLFFGGLWFTSKKMLTSRKPIVWYLGSFLIRVGFTLFGFYYLGQNNFKYLLICLLGFVTARFIIVRMTKKKEMEPMELEKQR